MITTINEFKQSLNENFNAKVKITPDFYDEQPINIFTLINAENMNFGDWETAIKWLINELKMDEELYNYFRSELSTKDDVVIGDIKIAGMDVIDHLRLVDVEKYDLQDDNFNEEIDYSEAYFKIDKFLPDDQEIQDEYYEIIDSQNSTEERIKELTTFLYNYMDESEFETYLEEGQEYSINDFAKYIIDSNAIDNESNFNESLENDDDVDLSKELKNQLYIGDFE